MTLNLTTVRLLFSARDFKVMVVSWMYTARFLVVENLDHFFADVGKACGAEDSMSAVVEADTLLLGVHYEAHLHAPIEEAPLQMMV